MASDYCKDIIILGKTGNGKSSLGNSLLNTNAFIVEDRLNSVTQECKKMANNNICVTDTPGLLDTEHHVADIALKILSSLNECPNAHAFIIVFSARVRMSLDELRTMNLLRIIFTQTCLDRTIIVFTGYSETKSDEDFENFWRENISMQKFGEACGGRVARIDNNASESAKLTRVKDIIALVDQVSKHGKSRFDSSFKELHEKVLNTQLSKQSESDDQDRIRIFDEEVLQINQALVKEYQSVWQKPANWITKETVGKILFGLGCVAAGFITVKVPASVPAIAPHISPTTLWSYLPTRLFSVPKEVPINEILQILERCLLPAVSTPEKRKELTNCITALIPAMLRSAK